MDSMSLNDTLEDLNAIFKCNVENLSENVKRSLLSGTYPYWEPMKQDLTKADFTQLTI